MHPELFKQYLQFCNFREEFDNFVQINFNNASHLYATTLLPLCNHLFKNPYTKRTLSANKEAANYVQQLLMKNKYSNHQFSNAVIEVPRNQHQSNIFFHSVCQFTNNDENLSGGVNAFVYIVEELVDNMYQHSDFTHALVMAKNIQVKVFLIYVYLIMVLQLKNFI